MVGISSFGCARKYKNHQTQGPSAKRFGIIPFLAIFIIECRTFVTSGDRAVCLGIWQIGDGRSAN